MEDVDELRQHVQTLKHHIIGNGGKGILKRIDEAEQDIETIQGNFVEKGECRRNRVDDYRNIEKEFDVIKQSLKDMKETRSDDKRMNVVIIGILASSLLSAASLVITVLGGGLP